MVYVIVPVCVYVYVCVSVYVNTDLTQAHLICNEGTSFVVHAKVDSFALKGHQTTVELFIE